MAIKYAPQPGSIVVCDYDGMIPEMTKRRPVVVLSSVSQDLAIVVPLSTTPPKTIKPWHYLVKLEEKLPDPYTSDMCWAKCDMVSAVSFLRLKVLYKGKDCHGKRQNFVPRLPPADVDAIRTGVIRALQG